jgi:hypothetical protein
VNDAPNRYFNSSRAHHSKDSKIWARLVIYHKGAEQTTGTAGGYDFSGFDSKDGGIKLNKSRKKVGKTPLIART